VTRPLIGISGNIRVLDGTDRAGVNAAYVHSIAKAGGVPILLTPPIAPAGADRAVEFLDGLVLTGGHDLDPHWYDSPPSPALGPLDRQRDEFELALFHAARTRGLPILGICRGLQLVNVAMGGTLIQDLPSEQPGEVHHDPAGPRDARTHAIRLSAGSRLHQALGTGFLETNSFHHQAIRELAPGLAVTARADDGLIEAVESRDEGGWLLAVQWHPEEFHRDRDSPDQRLFHALVEAASRRVRPLRETAPGHLPG
jgi:putative glutamine amidotransferase